MNSPIVLDVFIVGAGPIGLACGIEARKARLKYVIADKGVLVNSIYNYPVNMTFFSTSDKLEIGDVPFISHGNKPVRSEALEYYRRVTTEWNLNVQLNEQVENITGSGTKFIISTSQNIYEAHAVIIATGFYDIPHLLGVTGEQLPKVHHYYRDPHPYFGKKVLVVGAANSAVDAALECYRKNAQVTMVIRENSICERVKYWVKPDIENRIREQSIKAFFNSSLQHIAPRNVTLMTPDGQTIIENDFVLALTGYLPDFNFLINSGIKLSEDEMRVPFYHPGTMETNVPNLYLAGVVCGGKNTHQWFIENSRVHAPMIMRSIVGKMGCIT
jgi:thioredoxin reductase (NADPH)